MIVTSTSPSAAILNARPEPTTNALNVIPVVRPNSMRIICKSPEPSRLVVVAMTTARSCRPQLNRSTATSNEMHIFTLIW